MALLFTGLSKLSNVFVDLTSGVYTATSQVEDEIVMGVGDG
ncbi:MAG: hypothetical protein ACKOX6_17040 [Bdellovibrio sp.]